jgi:hypothetical protein
MRKIVKVAVVVGALASFGSSQRRRCLGAAVKHLLARNRQGSSGTRHARGSVSGLGSCVTELHYVIGGRRGYPDCG